MGELSLGIAVKKQILMICAGLFSRVLFGAPVTQEAALERAFAWMKSNPVMSEAGQTVLSVETFPNLGTYSVYVVQLSPRGYLVLNSDDRLPVAVCFSADSTVDLTDDPQNALRAMLLDYCERMADELSMPSAMAVSIPPETMAVTELYGPFLETSWNQNDPYNLFCPTAFGGSSSYDGRAPVGCVPVAYAQILNFHRWPVYGTASRSYTDSEGSVTGLHSAFFSDPYDWQNLNASHSPSDSESEQAAVGELMAELGVIAEIDYEASGSSSSTPKTGSRLSSYLFFESVETPASSAELIAPLETDLRAGFPGVISIPGHAVVADGLMVDGGTTTYHINYGWGGVNNGWYTAAEIPSAGSGPGADGGVTSLRPQLIAFPQTNTVSVMAGENVDLNWILPKRRENEVSQLAIKRLAQQGGTWSSDASEITGMNAGWELSGSGRSGNCWYVEQSVDRTGSASLLLNEIFVPDVSAQLTFWQCARLHLCSFSVEVSVDGGSSYEEVYSTNSLYESSWSYHAVSLAAYAGQEIRVRFRVDSDGGYYSETTLPGIRLDDLSVTSGDWYDWETFATDTTLASQRFSSETTSLDDCNDFSVFELTTTDPVYTQDWIVTNMAGVGNCFYKAVPEWGGCEYNLTSLSTITPSNSTRLLLHAKYMLSTDEFRVLVSTNGTGFTEIWSASGIVDWGNIPVDLSDYSGQAIYIRLEYASGNYYTGGGIWIDSISTQELTNPELEGQPVYYTTLTGLSSGTNTLAVTLTDTNAVEHAVGPAFILAVAVNENDTDSDGLPNDWETLYFGGATNANPSAMASNGINTVMETYIAGLNPTNPASFFKAALTNANGFVVQWNAASGRVYSVLGSTNLMSGFQTLETNIFWPQNCWTDTVERAGSFYQIDVQLQP